MYRWLTRVVALSLLAGAFLFPPSAAAETTSDLPFTFGIGAGFANEQTAAGVKPDYETFWVGPWTLKHGWGGPNNQMTSMRNAGITPAIHFYYWGDDISPSCVENGCYSSLHSAWKDRAGWQELARQLVHNLNGTMKGDPVVVFMETEFNKGGIEKYEPFDGYLAEKAAFIKASYPNAHIVMALGNWNSAAWGNFDRTASVSDSVGLQGMRGSTRDSSTSYDNLYETTLSGVKTARSLFGKPIFIQDVALSSYPTDTYTQKQADALQKFFTGIGDLRAAGVHALVYRTWRDNPNMDLNNYYREAERHWGLTAAYSGDQKPSASVWINGVKAVRAGLAPAPAPDTTTGIPQQPPAFSATFAPSSGSNEWWIDVSVKPASPIASVHTRVNGGSWIALPPTDWGTYAKSINAPTGSTVVFRATDNYGQTALSGTYSWLVSNTPSSVPPALSTKISPASGSNEWWVEAVVQATNKIGTVDVRVNDGTWTNLPATTWGTWAKSFNVPTGAKVVFRATDAYGQTAFSATYAWLSTGNRAPTAGLTATADGLTATLDGTSSSDPDGDTLTYTWDLGDGTKASGSMRTHTYAAGGTYTVTLTVSDGKASSTTMKSISVEQPNRAPTAGFTASGIDLTVTVDASASSDPDGDTLTYTWDWGDGSTGTGQTATHTYAGAGTYPVTLTVSDGQYLSAVSQPVDAIQPNRAPTASFTATTSDLTTSVDASASSDPDGDTLTYTWDWGDGTTGTGKTATHTYAAGGSYSVTLSVSDGELTRTMSQTVTAIQPNRAPAASFTATTRDLTTSVDASASSDPDGDTLTYTWDWGDGTTGTGKTATHTYAAGGTYTVKLTVNDGALTALATQSVKAIQPNRAPTASFTATTSDLTTSVDASASSDPDGDTLTYTWDWGDGTTGTGKTATHAYAKAGMYTVTLRVSDGSASAATSKAVSLTTSVYAPTFRLSSNVGIWWVEVYVDAPEQPTRVDVRVNGGKWTQLQSTDWGSYAKSMRVKKGSDVVFRATDPSGQAALSGNYKWLMSEPVNQPPSASFTAATSGLTASFDASASSDPNGDALTYTWNFGDGTTGTGKATTRTYAAAGSFTVTLTVSDGKTSASTSKSVTVQAPYSATFRVSPNVNEWWVEVYVAAPTAPTLVEAQVNGGSWVTLPLTSWGSYAKSFHVAKGSTVVFRATDAHGQTATSAPVTWLG